MGGEKKGNYLKKTLWGIAAVVAAGVIMAFLKPLIEDRSPEIIVRQFYPPSLFELWRISVYNIF